MTAAHQDLGTSFADYWKPRAGRKTCASWYLARLLRATRQISPLQPEYQEDINRVLTEINALPPAERAWTQLYVRRGDLTDKWGNYFVDANCVASLQAVGPDRIVEFLQRKRVTDDPDLWFDDGKRLHIYVGMAGFVLRHAKVLLRPQDAPILLDCGKDPVLSSFTGASRWAAAAAELTSQNDPAAAKSIIDAARQRFPPQGNIGEEQQVILIGALWRIAGMSEKQGIVDWFYNSYDGPVDFLRQVHEAQRPDTRALLATIVADPRFDRTNFRTLEALLRIVNKGLPEPLVGQQEISDAWPKRGKPENEVVHVRWREILRRHFAD